MIQLQCGREAHFAKPKYPQKKKGESEVGKKNKKGTLRKEGTRQAGPAGSKTKGLHNDLP